MFICVTNDTSTPAVDISEIKKGDIVNQSFDLMRISGLTSKMTPEDMERGLTILERMVLSYENNGLFLSYKKSNTYPTPDADEDSGLADSNVQRYCYVAI